MRGTPLKHMALRPTSRISSAVETACEGFDEGEDESL